MGYFIPFRESYKIFAADGLGIDASGRYQSFAAEISNGCDNYHFNVMWKPSIHGTQQSVALQKTADNAQAGIIQMVPSTVAMPVGADEN